MKYCTHCGAEVHEEAVVCIKCGRSLERPRPAASSTSDTEEIMAVVIKVFLILGCIAQGWLLLPLAWCIPMTVSIFNSLRDNRPISTGLKVCTLLFVNLVAGICLLCMENKNQ